MGGDGLYHEAVNGLQQRLMKEAGLDENDSSASLQPVPVPVGLIPAGNINDNDCSAILQLFAFQIELVSIKMKDSNVRLQPFPLLNR